MPQSILKKSTSLSPSMPNAPATRSREERNRETALHHARVLQQRKDMEALILASTEALLDLPTSVCPDPAHPSASDAAFVKNALRPFQPSDYVALIEERNINGKCGYVLCPQHNKKQNTEARYRIIHGNGRGPDALKFVPRKSLEKWCSDECGKRALYLKVQLSEEPSWTRVGSFSDEVVLLEDEKNKGYPMKGETAITNAMTNLNMDDEEAQILKNMKALAIERGDGDVRSKSFGLREFDVHENGIIDGKSASQMPAFGNSETPDHHESIEGYRPRFFDKGVRQGKRLDDKEEDIMPTI